jgi:DNA polymerase-3 subunit delta
LTRGKSRPFYILYGDEGYLIERAREEIVAALLPPQCRELNFNTYNADQASPSEVINACNTLPCLAQRRIVLVKGAHRYSQSDLKSFISYLRSPSPTTVLIFMGEGMTTDFIKEAKDGAFHLKRPSQGETAHWIRNIAQELGKEIAPDAVAFLQEAVGGDLQGLRNELAKVSLYIGDKKRIEVQDVEGVVSQVRINTIFELTKALGERNIKRVFRVLGTIWESGEPPLKILGMISRQFRHLLMTKEILAHGGGTAEVKKQVGISNPYYLKELSDQAKGFSQEALQRALRNLLETDLSLKRSPSQKRLILEGLVIKLCKSL